MLLSRAFILKQTKSINDETKAFAFTVLLRVLHFYSRDYYKLFRAC